jgi:exodeoxyribonuclease VII small subunit
MSSKQPKVDYQSLQDELDTILESLQDESLDIDSAMKHYERGLVIVQQLESYLKDAENTVRELQAKFNQV